MISDQHIAPGITLSELSRRLGRSRAALRKLARRGTIPCNPDGTFDESAVRMAYARNTDPAFRKPLKRVAEDVQPKPIPARTVTTIDEARDAVSLIRRVLQEEGRNIAPAELSYEDVRMAETILKARKHAQDIAEASKELLRKGPVLRHIEEAFANYRKELQTLPARYGAQIAAEVGCDVVALDAALSKVIRAHLEGLSAPVVH